MSDLRKAAEMALNYFESAYELDSHEIEIREALRQALAQPEQEPVAWVYNGILHEFDPSEFATSEVKPLYTAPQKREWVGLTDEDFYGQSELQVMAMKYAEAKLKEKNT